MPFYHSSLVQLLCLLILHSSVKCNPIGPTNIERGIKKSIKGGELYEDVKRDCGFIESAFPKQVEDLLYEFVSCKVVVTKPEFMGTAVIAETGHTAIISHKFTESNTRSHNSNTEADVGFNFLAKGTISTGYTYGYNSDESTSWTISIKLDGPQTCIWFKAGLELQLTLGKTFNYRTRKWTHPTGSDKTIRTYKYPVLGSDGINIVVSGCKNIK